MSEYAMFFEYSLDVPAGTTETQKVAQDLKLTAGIIHYVEFQFPAGCQFLVHCRVMRGGVQIWPRNRSGNISGEFFPVAFNEFLDLKSESNLLVLEAWNEDEVEDHTIKLRLAHLKLGEYFPEVDLADAIRSFHRLFRRR